MNKWKYATLSEKEKLERISNGDDDLYKSEISNARAYRSLLNDSGIDTTRTDEYISKIETAAGKINSVGISKSTPSKNTGDSSENKPKYLQGRKNDEMLMLIDKLEKVYKSYISQRENLKSEAERSRQAALEKLNIDGYSTDGIRGKKVLDEVTERYGTLLKELDEKYLPDIEKVSRILGLM